MKSILIDEDLWGIVDGLVLQPITINNQPPWDKKDVKARANLLMGLKDSHLHHVSSLKTSKKIWYQLQSIFPTKDVLSKVLVTK
jgi:hypothetical protein